MNSSLRDQLLAAGLVTEEQIRKANEQQQRAERAARGSSNSKPTARPLREAKPPPPERPRAPPPPVAAQRDSAHAAASQGSAPKLPGSPVAAAQAAKSSRDVQLNQRQHEKALRKARRAEIEELVERTRLPRLESEDWYSFIDGKKIRRCAVDAQHRQQLMSGELVVVRHKGYYAVVPAATADRLRELDPQLVLRANTSPPGSEPEGAYTDFAIPDDLTW